MMRLVILSTTVMSVLALVVLASGCADDEKADGGPVEMSGSPPGDDHSGHDHENEHEGPHHGHVIELGRNHEYHAELVDDESANTVTVYILDGELKELKIDAGSISMNLMVDGQAKNFELAAATNGQASRFDAKGKALFEALHVHEAEGKLSVAINGTPYTGQVEHHDHEHDDSHDGHDH